VSQISRSCFAITVHHVDTAFYDRHYRPGFITPAIRAHHEVAHRGEASDADIAAGGGMTSHA